MRMLLIRVIALNLRIHRLNSNLPLASGSKGATGLPVLFNEADATTHHGNCKDLLVIVSRLPPSKAFKPTTVEILLFLNGRWNDIFSSLKSMCYRSTLSGLPHLSSIYQKATAHITGHRRWIRFE